MRSEPKIRHTITSTSAIPFQRQNMWYFPFSFDSQTICCWSFIHTFMTPAFMRWYQFYFVFGFNGIIYCLSIRASFFSPFILLLFLLLLFYFSAHIRSSWSYRFLTFAVSVYFSLCCSKFVFKKEIVSNIFLRKSNEFSCFLKYFDCLRVPYLFYEHINKYRYHTCNVMWSIAFSMIHRMKITRPKYEWNNSIKPTKRPKKYSKLFRFSFGQSQYVGVYHPFELTPVCKHLPTL